MSKKRACANGQSVPRRNLIVSPDALNCSDSSVSTRAQTPSALGVLYAEWLKNNEAIARADGEFSRTSRTQDDEDRLLTRLFLNEKDIECQIFDAPCDSGFDLAIKCLVALHLHQERLSDVALECIKQDAASLVGLLQDTCNEGVFTPSYEGRNTPSSDG